MDNVRAAVELWIAIELFICEVHFRLWSPDSGHLSRHSGQLNFANYNVTRVAFIDLAKLTKKNKRKPKISYQQMLNCFNGGKQILKFAKKAQISELMEFSLLFHFWWLSLHGISYSTVSWRFRMANSSRSLQLHPDAGEWFQWSSLRIFTVWVQMVRSHSVWCRLPACKLHRIAANWIGGLFWWFTLCNLQSGFHRVDSTLWTRSLHNYRVLIVTAFIVHIRLCRTELTTILARLPWKFLDCISDWNEFRWNESGENRPPSIFHWPNWATAVAKKKINTICTKYIALNNSIAYIVYTHDLVAQWPLVHFADSGVLCRLAFILLETENLREIYNDKKFPAFL